MTPASTRTRDSWTEARTGPSVPLYTRNGRRQHTIQGTCDDTASWPPRRPADGQQRAALRREGDGTRSWGLISPSRRMFSTAPAGVLSLWCIRVTSESTSAQKCPASAFRQKTTLRTPRWRSPRASAPNRKSRPAAQRTGGHRRVATRKTTGDLTTPRGAGDAKARAEWITVSRHGHLRSAPVVVDAGSRTEWEPPTLRAALSDPTRPAWASPSWFTASPSTNVTDSLLSSLQSRTLRRVLSNNTCSLQAQNVSAVLLFRRSVDHRQLPAFGLYVSLRHLVPMDGWDVKSCTRVRSTVSMSNRSCKNALFPKFRSLSATFWSLGRGALRSLDLV